MSFQPTVEEERRMLFVQLDYVTTRSRLLQRALSRLYAALAFFVGTSVSIGLVAITSSDYTIIPIALLMFTIGIAPQALFNIFNTTVVQMARLFA